MSRISHNFFGKMCKNCAHCKINDNLLLDSGLCLKPHQWLIISTQEKKFSAQTRWSVSISSWSIALRHLTQRKKYYGFWLLGAKSFPQVYYMNDFAALISSRKYTLGRRLFVDIKKFLIKPPVFWVWRTTYIVQSDQMHINWLFLQTDSFPTTFWAINPFAKHCSSWSLSIWQFAT